MHIQLKLNREKHDSCESNVESHVKSQVSNSAFNDFRIKYGVNHKIIRMTLVVTLLDEDEP